MIMSRFREIQITIRNRFTIPIRSYDEGLQISKSFPESLDHGQYFVPYCSLLTG